MKITMIQECQFINHSTVHVTINRYTLPPRGKVLLVMDMTQDLVNAFAAQKVEVRTRGTDGKFHYWAPGTAARTAPVAAVPAPAPVVEAAPAVAAPEVAPAPVVEDVSTPAEVVEATETEESVSAQEDTSVSSSTTTTYSYDDLMALHHNKLRKIARRLGLDHTADRASIVDAILTAQSEK